MSTSSPARMAEIAASAGLTAPDVDGATTAELVAGQACQLGDGEADFVVAPALSSTDAAGAERLLAEAARVLRDGGLAAFGYHAAPGAFPTLLARALGRPAAAGKLASGAKAAVLAQLDLVAASAPPSGLYARTVAAQRAAVAQRDPATLLRDELAPQWQAIAVADLAAQAAAHGLTYVDELLPADRWRERTPAETAAEIARVAGPDASDQQQYVDDMLGPLRHESLFVKSGAVAARADDANAGAAGPTDAEVYDAVLYPSRPIFECQPSRMAVIAALAGIEPPAIAGATVVDLGCGIATNLLSVAARNPEITAIGVDPSGGQIDFGVRIADDAGLANVSLVHDVRAPLDAGTADYVMAHGVMTWVDDATRAAVIAEAARITRDGGLVMLSYNVSPGALYRTLTRSIGRRAAKAEIDAGDPQAAKDVLLQRLHTAAQSAQHGVPHAQLALEEAQRVADVEPGTLFHDELNPHWTPLRVSDLAELAAEHGLAYVGELRPADRWDVRLAELAMRSIVERAGASRVAQQQLVDDMLGNEFHASLFVRADEASVPVVGGSPRPAGPPVEQWHVTSQPAAEWPQLAEADRSAVATEIAQAGDAGCSVGQIASRTGLAADHVHTIASTFDGFGLARLELAPEPHPAASTPGERPQASRLVQAELRSGQERASSLDHRDVELDHPLVRDVLLLLDGTRDRATLAAQIRELPHDGAPAFADALDDGLQALANAGLLSA